MSKGADGLWVNAPLTNPTAGLGAALLSQVAVRVVVNVATNAYVQTNTSFQGLPTNGVYVPSARIYTNGVVPGFDPVASQYSTTGFGGGVAAEWYKLFSVNNWEVDQAGKEIIFHPPSNFYDQFLIPPTSISVEVAGASPGWTIRVVCPNVASLSANSANRKLTFVSLFSSIKLDGGFNGSASDKGSMIVSPVVSVVNPRIGSMPATPVVGGVVLTECLDPSAPFYAFDYTGVPKILGSLVVWNRTVIPGLGLSSQRATLQPDSQYLSGEKLPPLVPCVSDVRIGTKSFNTYQMSAVMPTTP
jgi:hypothetical protein